MFKDAFQGQCVLVTGHTGFKGSWLTTWLLKLGANVIGVSKDIPTNPSMFDQIKLNKKIKHITGDVRDLDTLKNIIVAEKPNFIFHLAAQAIVSTSFVNPVETMTTNIIGSMNLLEALKELDDPCTVIMITSDKSYDNVEWVWGYRETDALGGKDIYSGSKAAAELVIRSYIHTFFKDNHPVKIAVGRAGNVVGGGDWAQDRIIADCMRAWSCDNTVEIRSPNATRPWQHVLEPLSGYLTLAMQMGLKPHLHGEAFNFGPRAEQSHTVANLIVDLEKSQIFSGEILPYKLSHNPAPFHESRLLKLNCDKALYWLNWESNLGYQEMIELIGDWYSGYYRGESDMYNVTLSQISRYESAGIQQSRVWAV